MAYLRSNLIVWYLLLCLLVTVCLLFLPGIYADLHAVDIQILRFVHSGRLTALDPFFIFITNTSTLLSILVILITALLAYIRQFNRLKQKTLQLIVTLLVSSVFIKALKYLIGRERPFNSYNFLERLIVADSPSFPSGHTFAAFAFATALVLLFKNRWVRFIVLIWATLVSFSRMVLGVHYLSDVLVGVILGVLTAYAIHALYLRKSIHPVKPYQDPRAPKEQICEKIQD